MADWADRLAKLAQLLDVDGNPPGGGAVDSVNGATGVVVLDAGDVGAQPLDSDLTAIAALTTTAYGRALLELADAAAGRTALGLGTAAVAASGDFQPIDSDLTAIAALTTTSYGRSLLEAANAAALRTLAGLVIGTDVQAQGAYAPGGTDVPVADGGTGASTAAGARTNLGLGTASTIPIPYLPYRTGGGQYYGTWTGAVSGLVLVLNTMYCAPFFVPVTTTFTKIAVVATGVASSSARLGIYSDTAGVPDALVLDAGTVATTASAIATITISQQLTPGWYWLTAAIQGAASNLYCNNSGFFANANLPASAPGFSMISGGYSVTGISGALPSPWGATKTESARCPVIWLAPA